MRKLRKSISMIKEAASFQPSRLGPLSPNSLSDKNKLAATRKYLLTEQKVFQRPFSQANGYLINQTGNYSKRLQNNCIQHLRPKLLSWAFSSFSVGIEAADHFPRHTFVFCSRQNMTDSDKENYILILPTNNK